MKYSTNSILAKGDRPTPARQGASNTDFGPYTDAKYGRVMCRDFEGMLLSSGWRCSLIDLPNQKVSFRVAPTYPGSAEVLPTPYNDLHELQQEICSGNKAMVVSQRYIQNLVPVPEVLAWIWSLSIRCDPSTPMHLVSGVSLSTFSPPCILSHIPQGLWTS